MIKDLEKQIERGPTYINRTEAINRLRHLFPYDQKNYDFAFLVAINSRHLYVPLIITSDVFIAGKAIAYGIPYIITI